MRFFLCLIDAFMPGRWYICHEEWDQNGYVGKNYFGPFTKRGAGKRINDEYADLLRYGFDEVYVTKLYWLDARDIAFIASKNFWDEQAETLQDDEPPAWRDS